MSTGMWVLSTFDATIVAWGVFLLTGTGVLRFPESDWVCFFDRHGGFKHFGMFCQCSRSVFADRREGVKHFGTFFEGSMFVFADRHRGSKVS